MQQIARRSGSACDMTPDELEQFEKTVVHHETDESGPALANRTFSTSNSLRTLSRFLSCRTRIDLRAGLRWRVLQRRKVALAKNDSRFPDCPQWPISPIDFYSFNFQTSKIHPDRNTCGIWVHGCVRLRQRAQPAHVGTAATNHARPGPIRHMSPAYPSMRL
jgi:hypothetical protein